MAEFKSAWHHQVWEENEWVWVLRWLEWECFWVNLREDNKVSDPRWQCLNPRWQNQDGCHHQVESEWMREVFFQNGWFQEGRIQDGCHHQDESEWMSEVFFCWKWLNPRWQNSRCLTSSSWVRRNEWSIFFVQNGWIKDGTIQHGCHHEVKWEWMSLSQIELVWVRVRVEWECFWVNLREDNKVSESKMAVAKMAAIIELSQNELKMAAIIKLSEFEWMSEVFWMQDVKIHDGRNSRCPSIIRMSQNEWVKFFIVQNGWFQDLSQNPRW